MLRNQYVDNAVKTELHALLVTKRMLNVNIPQRLRTLMAYHADIVKEFFNNSSLAVFSFLYQLTNQTDPRLFETVLGYLSDNKLTSMSASNHCLKHISHYFEAQHLLNLYREKQNLQALNENFSAIIHQFHAYITIFSRTSNQSCVSAAIFNEFYIKHGGLIRNFINGLPDKAAISLLKKIFDLYKSPYCTGNQNASFIAELLVCYGKLDILNEVSRWSNLAYPVETRFTRENHEMLMEKVNAAKMLINSKEQAHTHHLENNNNTIHNETNRLRNWNEQLAKLDKEIFDLSENLTLVQSGYDRKLKSLEHMQQAHVDIKSSQSINVTQEMIQNENIIMALLMHQYKVIENSRNQQMQLLQTALAEKQNAKNAIEKQKQDVAPKPSVNPHAQTKGLMNSNSLPTQVSQPPIATGFNPRQQTYTLQPQRNEFFQATNNTSNNNINFVIRNEETHVPFNQDPFFTSDFNQTQASAPTLNSLYEHSQTPSFFTQAQGPTLELPLANEVSTEELSCPENLTVTDFLQLNIPTSLFGNTATLFPPNTELESDDLAAHSNKRKRIV